MNNNEQTCITCNFYNECPFTGFESCKLGKDIPTSKNSCENYRKKEN